MPLFYVSEDKIKAKIEEINHVKENSKCDLYRVSINFAIDILQSLLGKE